ncbi:hypothetical protein AB0G67_49120, partial [Streptomyces sp. NPDC021056]|uniref:hypothetical protein n=1 Tax=Streptomyces sp. NPDC021056 TaxID=3155012 RepID=UPI0034031504
IELFTKQSEYPIGVYTLPKHLDEKARGLLRRHDAPPLRGGSRASPGKGGTPFRLPDHSVIRASDLRSDASRTGLLRSPVHDLARHKSS